eukprot:6582729-Prymnesium_polylepis.1
MEDYSRVLSSAVPGALLQIHGSHKHTYSVLTECASACSAHADCAGFVDNRAEFDLPTCVFKTSTEHTPRAHKDFYYKRRRRCAVRSVSDRRQLLADGASRIFAVDGFLSADEAALLRERGRACFDAGAGKVNADSRIPRAMMASTYFGDDHGCVAGPAAPVLSAVEHRIAALLGIPSHQGENPLMITRSLPHHGANRVRNIHHDVRCRDSNHGCRICSR